MARIEAAAVTHAGRKRQSNQDAVLMLPEHDLWAVCDGMGGHAGGEVASALAVQRIRDFHQRMASPDATWPILPSPGMPVAEGLLEAALRWANQGIYEAARADRELRGMGTTVIAVRLAGDDALVAHCGDSRAYMVRDGVIQALTEDHSMVAQLVRNGMPRSEALASGWAHQINRALGLRGDDPGAVVSRVQLKAGDVLILCSDGLTDELSDAEIGALVRAHEVPQALVDALLASALEAGGRDNVSVVALRVLV